GFESAPTTKLRIVSCRPRTSASKWMDFFMDDRAVVRAPTRRGCRCYISSTFSPLRPLEMPAMFAVGVASAVQTGKMADRPGYLVEKPLHAADFDDAADPPRQPVRPAAGLRQVRIPGAVGVFQDSRREASAGTPQAGRPGPAADRAV